MPELWSLYLSFDCVAQFGLRGLLTTPGEEAQS